MKQLLAVALVISLVAPASPVNAQEQQVFPTNSISQSVAREALRLAAIDQSTAPGDAGWERVRTLAGDAEILVTVRGAQPVRRYFVAATDAEIGVRESGQNVTTIGRGEVAEITRRHVPGHTAAIGALIGAVGGVGIVFASFGTNLCGSDGCYGQLLILLFASVGAAAGAGIGKAVGVLRKHKMDLIYRAP